MNKYQIRIFLNTTGYINPYKGPVFNRMSSILFWTKHDHLFKILLR